MAPTSQTLLHYLTSRNPGVNVDGCRTGPNTTSKSESWLWPIEMAPWEDFNYSTLWSTYDGYLKDILNSECEPQEFSDLPWFPFCEIHDENSFTSLVIKWNQSVVSQALSITQEHGSSFWPREKIYMVKGGQAQLPPPLDSKRPSLPDWAAIKRTPEAIRIPQKSSSVLPGETKLSKKWHSNGIMNGKVEYYSRRDKKKFGTICTWEQHWLPLRQLFTYCLLLETKHGYIITDKELVVVRVSPSVKYSEVDCEGLSQEVGDSQDSYKPGFEGKQKGYCMEYKAIPWDASSDAGTATAPRMTINLALWWLHLIAADDSSIVFTNRLAAEQETTQSNIESASQSFSQPVVESADVSFSQSIDAPATRGSSPPIAESANQSFSVSEVGRGFAGTSLDCELITSFQPEDKTRKRSRERDGEGSKKRKGKRRAAA